MKTQPPLSPKHLRAVLDPARIPYASSADIPKSNGNNGHLFPQFRAREALELALHIKDNGYNIYLSGESNLGRSKLIKDYLRPRARKMPTPPDLIYVHNFDNPDEPRLISLPAGQGKKLKTALARALTRIRKELPGRFEHAPYIQRQARLMEAFQGKRQKVFKEMDLVAEDQGFNLDMDEQGSLTLYPLVEGKRLSEEEFEKLDSTMRDGLKLKGDKLLQVMAGLMRRLTRAEIELSEKERGLEREVVEGVLDKLLTPLAESFGKVCNSEPLRHYFADLRKDILENPEHFIPREHMNPTAQGDRLQQFSPEAPPAPPLPDDMPGDYDINVFVDNAGLKGAPLILDDHPVPHNLLGCIEREAEMGTLITDFTLIKAGSLHKANGGFLVVRVEELLQHPAAWEGLLRALRSGGARIEDTAEEGVRTKGLAPEPLCIDVKVILIGGEDIFETLLLADERFGKLFKVKAHLAEVMPRNAAGTKVYLNRIRDIIEEAKLLPFDREAMAGVVDFGSLLCEDQRKLSLKFPLVREMMIEASALAGMSGQDRVDLAALKKARQARIFRANLYEEQFMEEYDRGLIKVPTSGAAVGRVNGLSVTWYGDFEFGLPHQISCTVGVGHDGIVDLEREAKLAGPIHTKAMMILKSYLVSLFAHNKPLVLTGSLYFEQSYAGVEGDSASGAELTALLSALADVPVNLSLAFTGAVSQTGQIMAVGGVTRKIEGFYEVCKRHGLRNGQGVIIPKDNIDHLMLNDEVTAAAEAGKFNIYPVAHINEALELLTGLPAGRPRKDGTFTPGTLYHLVDKRLANLGRIAAAKGKFRTSGI